MTLTNTSHQCHPDSVKLLATMLVLRDFCVPSANTAAAAANTISTPSGWPAKFVNSLKSSSDTPTAAALTPSHCARRICAPKKATPNNAENTGMV